MKKKWLDSLENFLIACFTNTDEKNDHIKTAAGNIKTKISTETGNP